MKPSDELIVRQVRAGNKKAFESIFHAHYAGLCRFATQIVQDAEVAEELVQDFFVGFWERRDQLEALQSLSSYFHTSIRNASLNHLKHLKVRAAHQAHVLHQAEAGERTVEEFLAGEELSRRISETVETLPDRCREVFLLSRHDGLKYGEIAEKLNISIKTVEVQMGKALKIMRENLSDLLPIFLMFIFFCKYFWDWIRVI
ncbi:MAG: RNA polymerase sigma-70 factor [Bacteroidia bacterium]|nr:RNA polymerase sigma-70 factor [Bacteroidia bacterium]